MSSVKHFLFSIQERTDNETFKGNFLLQLSKVKSKFRGVKRKKNEPLGHLKFYYI